MQAVILAGGKGSRLQPFTEETPKALVEIDNRPIVEYLLLRLKNQGCDRVTLAVNHLAEKIENVLGDGSRYGLKISYSHEDKPLSTIAPLKLIDKLDNNFIVANGDILTDLNFDLLYKTHLENKASLTVAVHERKNLIDYGVIETDNSGLVTSFAEKPTHDYLVSMGIYVFSKKLLEIVPDNEPFGFDNLMLSMLKKNLPVHTYRYSGYWRDIGRVEDYLAAMSELDTIKKLIQ